jgi:hypothetical protein
VSGMRSEQAEADQTESYFLLGHRFSQSGSGNRLRWRGDKLTAVAPPP